MNGCSQIEYHPTILSSRGLLQRLALELRFTFEEIRHAWPELKRDPIGFAKLTLLASGTFLRSCLRTPALASGLAGVLVVLTAVMFVALMDRADDDRTVINENDTLLVEMLTIPTPDQSSLSTGNGIGSRSQGRIGFDKRKGEGSETKPKRGRGGGGGGLNQQLVVQQGKPPAPSEIPAPIPQLPPARKQVLPMAGIDIDPAVWKNLPFPRYGDPRSTSTALSNGPGDRGGMGTGTGTGVGEGRGDGFGPGSDGNIGDGRRDLGGGGPGCGLGSGSGSGCGGYYANRIIPASMAAQRARVLSKPEPHYTEEARRNQISGTVVLRVVFSESGQVTNIRAIHTLPFGLTEKAIAAARQIRFLPAIHDNRPVSVYMQLEYNFNLY